MKVTIKRGIIGFANVCEKKAGLLFLNATFGGLLQLWVWMKPLFINDLEIDIVYVVIPLNTYR